jgi:nucleotide-binding universal stress UspA family protein
MSRRILVPVDGSAASRRGLKEAVRLAKAQRAKLFLLTVVDLMPLFVAAEAATSFDSGTLESLRLAGRKVLDKAAAETKKQGVTATAVLVDNLSGRVADVIVRQARKLRADLIVIGTHGRRGISRLVMGSDAELVVRQAPVPVLLVRASGR